MVSSAEGTLIYDRRLTVKNYFHNFTYYYYINMSVSVLSLNLPQKFICRF